jgi:hypothetical protein
MRITGVVQSGAGKGAYFTQVDWVVRQCEEKLGFAPYPGTLNVNIRDEDLPKLGSLLEIAPLSLVPDDPAFCAARVQPVEVQGIPAALVLPSEEVRIHEHRVVEIMAPCHLKQALAVKDGDSIHIDIRPATQDPAVADLHRTIYEFASSAGALEGFVYDRQALEASELDSWVRNLSAQCRDLPAEVRAAFQPALNRTLGRAVHSLVPLLGTDHPHLAALRSMVIGAAPSSADDFEVDKAQKAARYS